jgi:hypothetical protein
LHRSLGVPDPELFITADLFEARNLSSVVKNILALHRMFAQKVCLQRGSGNIQHSLGNIEHGVFLSIFPTPPPDWPSARAYSQHRHLIGQSSYRFPWRPDGNVLSIDDAQKQTTTLKPATYGADVDDTAKTLCRYSE